MSAAVGRRPAWVRQDGDMAEQDDARVGVYIDFDNIVISRADQARDEGFADATVDLDAIIDFASSYGRVTISRAYADWSEEKNAKYRDQLTRRAVDLTQLFPVSRSKNGADIRLAIDVVEDLFRHDDITHVVIVAGDSDYIPLAQRVKRLSRIVIGIGVAGSVSRKLAAATDEYRDYDSLIIAEKQLIAAVAESEPKAEPEKRAKTGPVSNAQSSAGDAQKSAVVGKSRATQLLIRATRFISEKKNTDWVALSEVKNQMLRLEPQFQESELGFDQFSKFVASRHSLIELNENRVRLRPSAAKVAAG